MNRSIILVTVIALGVAILVAMVVSKTLGGKSDSAGGNFSTTQILVAANRLKIGDKIAPDDLKWMDWPDNAVFAGVIKRKPKAEQKKDEAEKKKETKDEDSGVSVVNGDSDKKKKKSDDEDKYADVEPGKDKLVGKMVRRVVEKNEPVTTNVVIDNSEGNLLAAKLGEGMRAIGVKIKADTSAGGFMKAGDYVDVILTYQLRNTGGSAMALVAQKLASQTILSNVRVLAIDQTAQPKGEKDDDKVKVGKTATLELSRKQAETLALANQMGDLTLVLRRLGEEDKPGDKVTMDFTTDVMTADVLRMQAEIISSGGGGSSANGVRVYSGPNTNDVSVRGTIKIPTPQDMQNSN